MELTTTGVTGLSLLSVFTFWILSTMSMPEVTLPNTGCWEGVDLSNQSRNELCTCGGKREAK